jgi:nitrate/nitrite-specific signal transduction histidine kinase
MPGDALRGDAAEARRVQNKQEFSPSFVRKMMERMHRCYQRLDELSHDFRADVDLGQIAAAFRIPLPRG